MKNSLLLSAALASVLWMAPVAPVLAQAGGVDAPVANTRAARRAREAKKNGATSAAPLYPNATRQSPKQSGDPKLNKQLGALFALQEKSDSEDEMIAKADEILASPNANAFDKSSAAYLAGGAWQSKETKDYSQAIKYYKQAIDTNGLHNNMHYQAMLQTAQLLNADDKADQALVMVDRFLTETKSEDSKAIAIKNQILMNSKPEAAIGFLEQQVKAKPTDKKLMLNLASAYQQSGQEAKAIAILDKMHKGGMFTESSDYDVAWRLLANTNDREKDALALIDEGLAKGILTPSAEVYVFQGQSYYAADQVDKAIAAWAKGAPLAKTGETSLNLGKALAEKERWAEAKAAGQAALAKGVKRQGDAWQVIGESEAELGNKAAATAAYKEAAKYPETKRWADSQLRSGAGK